MVYWVSKQTSFQDVFTLATIDDVVDYFKDKPYIQVDTETEGFFNHQNRILLLQLGTGEDQFVIDFPFLSSDEREKISKLLSNNSIKLLHNAKFDYKFLKMHGIELTNVYDTMLAEMLLYSGLDTEEGFYSLKGLADRYLSVSLDKSVRGEIHHVITTRVINYAAADVTHLEAIMHKQLPKLVSLGLSNGDTQDELTVLGLENQAVLAFADIEYNGMPIDPSLWNEVRIEIKGILEKLKQELVDIVCSTPALSKWCYTYQDLFTAPVPSVKINWNSPVQKLALIKAIVPTLTSTSERDLGRHKKQPLIGKLLEYSKMNKLLTAFANKLLGHMNPVTGRIHTEFKQILKTGRVSCSNPK